MADSWFRFYNNAHAHPKIMMLSDGHFRSWTKLLSLASTCGGVIPCDLQLVSKALGKPPQRASDVLQVMLSARLFDATENGYVPHNWDKKQFLSDTSTPRVKRFRERQGNVSETDHRQRHRQSKKETSTERDALFEEFWQASPKKTGRGGAEKAWARSIKIESPENLIAAMRRYAKTQVGKDPAYIKTPGPWLTEKRWMDEAIASPQSLFENTNEQGWRSRVQVFRNNGGWAPKWGPKPTEDGCKCPPEILKEAA